MTTASSRSVTPVPSLALTARMESGSTSNNVNICSLQTLKLITQKGWKLLLPNSFRVCAREVNLVHGSYQFQVMSEGEIEVGDSLGLDSLVGVH